MNVLVATTCKPDDRKTLGTIRALAREGSRITVGSDRYFGQVYYSRYLNDRIRYPHPREDKKAFIRSLQHHLKIGNYDVMLPMCDYTTVAIAEAESELSTFTTIPIPSSEILQITRNKARTLDIADSLGIAVPFTCRARDMAELQETAKTMSYPCVIKLREGFGGLGLWLAENEQDLLENYPFNQEEEDFALIRSQPLIQEYISGEIHDVCLLFNHGQVRAGLTQKRLKMYPSRGGVGILNETTNDPSLLDKAVKLLTYMNWHGPAQVEFKVDHKTRAATLMEINGRYWGTLDLAIRAGINFPLLACRMAINGDIPRSFTYQVGLRYRWTFPYGLLHFFENRFNPRSLQEFFFSGKQVVSDFRLSDPLPPVAEGLYILQRMWARKYSQVSASRHLFRRSG